MNRWKLWTLLILTVTEFACGGSSSLSALSESGNVQLLTNGVYQTPDGSSTWDYFRFYEDGTVLEVPSTGAPSELASWFSKSNQSTFSAGTYKLNGQSIAFQTTSSFATVDFNGTVGDGSLTLNYLSHANGTQGTRTYTFFAVTFTQ